MAVDLERTSGRGSDAAPVGVFVVSGHALERRALQETLEDEGLRVLGATGSVAEALARVPVLLPDVAILDTRIHEDVWIAVCRRIWDESPSVRCLTLGSLGSPAEVRGSVLAGAWGHAVRAVRGSDLLRRVRVVAAGKDLVDPAVRAAVLAEFGQPAPGPSLLAPAARRILFLCAEGLSDRQIRGEMGLGEVEFEALLRSALGKLGYAAAAADDVEPEPPVPEPA
ncbi:response regulator [Sinomonas humi]|uniref:response regulator n=1 Tax=Sinomonas humi TaxID=1338436 RepID=UPI0018CDF6D1|nr:response regulator [Sinomonas humi]